MMRLAHGEVSVWDFGGQLEYAVTHQLLLSVEVNIKDLISSSHQLIHSTDRILYGTDGDLRRVLWSVGLARCANRATRILAQLPSVYPPIIPWEQIEVAGARGGNKEWKGRSAKEHRGSHSIMAAEMAQHPFPQPGLRGVIIQEWRSASTDSRHEACLRHHLQATHHPHSKNLQATSSVHPGHPARQVHHRNHGAES